MYRDVPADQLAVLAEVMRHLDRAAPSPAANRRKAVRRQMRATIEAIVLAGDQNQRVRVFTRNISTAGIGFVSRRSFRMGDEIAFRFSGCHPTQKKVVIAKVTFVRYLRKGMYETGAEFMHAMVESDAPGQLRRILADHL